MPRGGSSRGATRPAGTRHRREIHDRLIAGRPAPTAVLTIHLEAPPARTLYLSRGWTTVDDGGAAGQRELLSGREGRGVRGGSGSGAGDEGFAEVCRSHREDEHDGQQPREDDRRRAAVGASGSERRDARRGHHPNSWRATAVD